MKIIKSRRNGFTLLEMLAVLFIIGIILSIAVPTFGPMMKTAKVKENAKLIYKTLEFARQYAINYGTDTIVAFAISNPSGSPYNMAYRAYKVYVPSKGTVEDWKFLHSGLLIDSGSTIFGKTLVNIPFPNDGDADGTVAQVTFSSNGTPTTMAGIKVVDGQDTTVFREVTYDNVTGRITLKDLGE